MASSQPTFKSSALVVVVVVNARRGGCVYLESGNVVELVTFDQLMNELGVMFLVFVLGLASQIFVLLRYLQEKE